MRTIILLACCASTVAFCPSALPSLSRVRALAPLATMVSRRDALVGAAFAPLVIISPPAGAEEEVNDFYGWFEPFHRTRIKPLLRPVTQGRARCAEESQECEVTCALELHPLILCIEL
jgi:hypothetical protein